MFYFVQLALYCLCGVWAVKQHNYLLRIYKDYVEVVRPLKPVETFDDLDWQSIESQDIYIHNCGQPYLLHIHHYDKGGQGQVAYLRVNDTGNITDQRQALTIVDSHLGLVRQDLANEQSRYFYVNMKSLEYDCNPLRATTELNVETISGQPCGKESSISYIQKNMKWTRIHELQVSENNPNLNDSVLTTWATVVNLGRDDKRGDIVELIADGDSFESNRYSLRSGAVMMRSEQIMDDFVPSEQSLHGVKVYPVNLPEFKIGAKQSIRLPLIVQNISVERWVSATNTLTYRLETNERFNRVYKVHTNEFVPGGKVTIRESNQRIVGRANIPTSIVQGESHKLKVGIDTDVLYKREMQMEPLANNRSLYLLRLHILNKRDETVNVDYIEESGQTMILDCKPLMETIKTKESNVGTETDRNSTEANVVKQTQTGDQAIFTDFSCELGKRKVVIKGRVQPKSDTLLNYKIMTKKLENHHLWF